MVQDLHIFGAGGHAISVASLAMACGYHLKAFVEDECRDESIQGIAIKSFLDCCKDGEVENIFIAVGDNNVRNLMYDKCRNLMPDVTFPNLIHPTANVSWNVRLGENIAVMPFGSIGPYSNIGNGCIVNSHASIDHDGEMESFSSLAPGCILGGNVYVGVRTAISIGAVISHRIRVGGDTVIGGGSFLLHDIPANKVAYGSPCRIVRNRERGEKYL